MARKSKQPKGKKMKPTFFIFCEGKTEATYVDLLRRTFRVPMEIIAKVSDSNISQPFIDRCKRERFTTKEDKTYLMFDLDVPGMLDRLRKIKGAIMLLSNLCIEFWFLLHYKDVLTELTTGDCINGLRKFDAEYSKGKFSNQMAKMLIDNISEAEKRALGKELFSNPSSAVYLLTAEIMRNV